MGVIFVSADSKEVSDRPSVVFDSWKEESQLIEQPLRLDRDRQQAEERRDEATGYVRRAAVRRLAPMITGHGSMLVTNCPYKS